MSPDITMCRYKKCPSSAKCYRFIAKPDPDWQSYFVGYPVLEVHGKWCKYYWPQALLDNYRREPCE